MSEYEYIDSDGLFNETNYENSEWMMYNYYMEMKRNMSRQPHYYQQSQGFNWAIENIIMILIYPAMLITNLLLLVAILRDAKLRREPWRWLVAHTALCILVTVFFLYVDLFTPTYLLPSLETTPICPAVKLIVIFFWQMIPVSVTLVLIERFRVIKSGNEKGSGMGKKAVIITLVCLWLLNIVAHVAGFMHHIQMHGRLFIFDEVLPGWTACYTSDTFIALNIKLIVSIWSTLSLIVVIIGSAVVGCKQTNDAMKRFVLSPTMIIGITYFLIYESVFFAEYIRKETTSHYNVTAVIVAHFLVNLCFLIFPTTWLVTWSLNGDLVWSRELFHPCLPNQHQVEFDMLEDKEHP